MSDTITPGKGIDPRGPRFAAGITALLLLIDLFLALPASRRRSPRTAPG